MNNSPIAGRSRNTSKDRPLDAVLEKIIKFPLALVPLVQRSPFYRGNINKFPPKYEGERNTAAKQKIRDALQRIK